MRPTTPSRLETSQTEEGHDKAPSEINERTMIDFQSRLGLRRNQALSANRGSTGRNKKEVAFHKRGL